MPRQWIIAGVLALCSAIAQLSHAGVNTWSAVGPEGGSVGRVAMHPTNPNIAFVGAPSGVYRTTDGGTTWKASTFIPANPPRNVQIDPDDPTRVYVSQPGYFPIVESTDGAETFHTFDRAPVKNVFEPQLVLAKGGVTYFTAGLRIFRSTDRGANWTERTSILLPSDLRILLVAFEPDDPNTLYALAGEIGQTIGMFVSRDGAATWQHVGDPNQIRQLVANPGVPGEVWAARIDGLWKSSNYGTTWSNVFFTDLVEDLAVNVRGSATEIVVTSYPGVFRSSNGGSSWSNITGDLQFPFGSISVHPLDANVIMFSGQDGISVLGTTPGSWLKRNTGLIATQISSFDADPSTDRIYAFSGQIFASQSGGEFVRVNDAPLATIGTPPLPKLLTAIHAQPGTLLALLSEEFAQSKDGGSTWDLIPGFPANRTDQLWRASSARSNPTNLIVTGTQGAYHSTNGGQTWSRITDGLPTPDLFIRSVEFSQSNPLVVYLAPSSVVGTAPPVAFGVYRSIDGGTTWAPANHGIESARVSAIAVDPKNAEVVYAVADTALVKTEDGGASWRTLKSSLKNPAQIAIDPANTNVVYLTEGENDVWRSVTGGESFESLRSLAESPWWYPQAVIVDPLRPNVLNVGTQGFGVQQIMIEPDLALEWGTTPTSGVVGSTLSYTLFVKNLGPYGSSGAKVSFTLPSQASNIAVSTQSGSCTSERLAVCNLGPISANASIGISISMKAESADNFVTNADLAGDQPDSRTVNNTNAVSVPVTIAPPPTATPGNPASAPAHGGGGGGSVSLMLMMLGVLPKIRRHVNKY